MKTLISFIATALIGILMTSCSDKMYVHAPCPLEELNVNGSLAQEISEMGDENTTNTASVDLTINYGTGDNYRVQIYSANPSDESSYLLGYYMLNDESTTLLMCNLPENIDNLYVGIIDNKGNKMIKQVAMLNGHADVMFGTLMAAAE